MILITGGSYQGKLDYARERFHLDDGDIFTCSDETADIDLAKRCIACIDRFALNRVRAGAEPAATFRANPEVWRDAVIVTTDISCGVVPIDPELRAWREACGRMNNYLAREADEVWRLFCGIPQRLK